MKKSMQKQYGKEEGKKVYFATIRKQAMEGVEDDKYNVGEEGLRDWFGKSSGTTKSGRKVRGWVQVGGKYDGKPCARQPGQKSTPKCVSSSKRRSMSDKERDSAARRKRAADPNQPQKSGAAKPTNVSTDPKKKMSENYFNEAKDKKGKGSGTKDACYYKVKSRYSVWPSAYASGALVKCRKVGAANWGNSTKEEFVKDGISFHQFQEKCWKGYEKKGMKTMFGKRYPNCVKKEEVEIEEKKMVKVKLNPEKKIGVKVTDIGPGGKEVVRKNTMDEGAEVVTEVKDKKGKGSGSKDACYHKVKSRYSVWPSAYASGALVKCRKVGAANWGNSSKKEEFSDWKSEFIWEDGDSAKKITEDDMKGMSVKSGHKRPTKSGAGMTAKGVAAYRRRNPGSKLKTAVTTEPSKLKKGSKAANRRKSYCARSAGQMKKFPKAAKDPNSRLRQARRRWNC